MTRHLTRRMPGKRNRFCWVRIPQDSGGVLYRLYRRGMDSKVFAVVHAFPEGSPRAGIAGVVNRLRHRLREHVDEIDLRAMGVTNE